MVPGNNSPVALVDGTPPIFSLFGWWFFLPFISPSFPFLVFKDPGDVSPWSPADEVFPITWFDELSLGFPIFGSVREISIAEVAFS